MLYRYTWLFAFVAALTLLLGIENVIADDEDDVPDINFQEDIGFEQEDVKTVYDYVESNATETLTSEKMSELMKKSELHQYQTEVSRMIGIIINSVYGDKEVFLRELVSNAADAIEKIRFASVTNPDILKDKPELYIWIEYDADDNTITLTDSGCGMTKDELINNLGTIAKSGTANFLESLQDSNKNVSLIGQFGVGFYSAFLVADKVTVISKSTEEDEQYIWTSTADASFNLAKDPRGVTLGRGTKIVLHLKEDANNFLSEKTLKATVQKFSQFIPHPIYLRVNQTYEEEVAVEDTDDKSDADKSGEDSEKENSDEDKSDEIKTEDKDEEKEKKKEKKDKKKTEKIKKWKYSWEQINTQKAIWLRPKEEITKEEYTQFYRALAHQSYGEPLTHIHFAAEGEVEFRCIIFIPEAAPYNMWETYMKKTDSLKLYVRRVMVSDSIENMIPKYFNFLRGVVDSDDLPLKVDRENLAQKKIIDVIGKRIVRKVLDQLKKLAKEHDTEMEEYYSKLNETETETHDKSGSEEEEGDDKKKTPPNTSFKKFMKEFGKSLKYGCQEDESNRLKIVKLLRFKSLKHLEQEISLDKYVEEMKEGQKDIYYLSGNNLETLKNSPLIQRLKKEGMDVLLFIDANEEGCISRLRDYENFKVTNVQKGKLKLDDEHEEKKLKALQKHYEPLTSWWQKQLTGEISRVDVTLRLVNDPVIVVSTEWGQSAQMEKMMKIQAFVSDEQQMYMKGSRVLEINPSHPIIKKMLTMVKDDDETNRLKDMASSLYAIGAVSSGYDLDKPENFVQNVYGLFTKDLGIEGEGIEEVEVEIEDDPPVEDDVNFDDLDMSKSEKESQSEGDIEEADKADKGDKADKADKGEKKNGKKDESRDDSDESKDDKEEKDHKDEL